MKINNTPTLISSLFAFGAMVVSAGTVSPSFNVDPASVGIDTTGDDIKDWGYFLPNADFLAGVNLDQQDGINFDSLKADYTGSGDGTGTFAIDPATNSKAVSGIGAVTITERDEAEYSNGSTSLWQFTVDDGLSPVSGTFTPLGAVNGVAGGEDIFNITLNDLGAGTSTVTLYMAHSNTGRRFDATIDLTAADGNDSGAVLSDAIGGGDGNTYFTFTTVVDTTDPLADLSISIDSNSGSSGQFAFAGYTVTSPVPEPSTTALLGLGGLALILRRRK